MARTISVFRSEPQEFFKYFSEQTKHLTTTFSGATSLKLTKNCKKGNDPCFRNFNLKRQFLHV